MKIILAPFMFFVSLNASASDWLFFSLDKESITMIDADSIKDSYGMVRMWSQITHFSKKLQSGKEVSSEKILFEFNCSKSEYTVEQHVAYGKGGEVISIDRPVSMGWIATIPDTKSQRLLDVACDKDVLGDLIEFNNTTVPEVTE